MFVDLSENPAVRVNDGFAKPRTILLTVCASIVYSFLAVSISNLVSVPVGEHRAVVLEVEG